MRSSRSNMIFQYYINLLDCNTANHRHSCVRFFLSVWFVRFISYTYRFCVLRAAFGFRLCFVAHLSIRPCGCLPIVNLHATGIESKTERKYYGFLWDPYIRTEWTQRKFHECNLFILRFIREQVNEGGRENKKKRTERAVRAHTWRRCCGACTELHEQKSKKCDDKNKSGKCSARITRYRWT